MVTIWWLFRTEGTVKRPSSKGRPPHRMVFSREEEGRTVQLPLAGRINNPISRNRTNVKHGPCCTVVKSLPLLPLLQARYRVNSRRKNRDTHRKTISVIYSRVELRGRILCSRILRFSRFTILDDRKILVLTTVPATIRHGSWFNSRARPYL